MLYHSVIQLFMKLRNLFQNQDVLFWVQTPWLQMESIFSQFLTCANGRVGSSSATERATVELLTWHMGIRSSFLIQPSESLGEEENRLQHALARDVRSLKKLAHADH
ncbi:hypothetical protein VNO78_32350 [Psophocarpus tetragonolobus]|uniref:Uncharacterized protein n=1 Tax=Psophocarpus tetragonolobus TaxID=3891 RepID=A0AAN9P2M7_PSOTE